MSNRSIFLFLLLLGFYFTLHLFNLTKLPVFADESIYIRWSQLIIDDFYRYLFYPMNDGKTPLLMWLSVPFLHLFADQLLAARLVSVIIGASSISFVFLLLRELKQEKAAWLAALLMTISPFTFFYHRLALTDALLLNNLIIAYYFAVKFVQANRWYNIFGLAFFFFLAIMSKTPALLFAPVFYLLPFLLPKLTWQLFFRKILFLSLGLLLSLLFFYSFRIVPLFSQLFAVGGNFIQDKDLIFSMEILTVATRNASFFFEQLLTYLGPLILLLAIPFFSKTRKIQLIFFISALIFLIPLILLGKIIYPRYILPSSFLIISSAAISLQNLSKKRVWQTLAVILIAYFSFNFIKSAYLNPDQLPLSSADREQFLEEWSSGHGIKETSEFILELAKTKRVAVATEGYFGTLPDGILLNLHKKNVDNIYVEGIGQPIRTIPENFLARAADFELKILVVNSHRLKIDLPKTALLKSFCRPNQAPCLQIWELNEEILSKF